MDNTHAVNDSHRAAHPRAITNLRRYAATAANIGGILHKGAVPFVDFYIASFEMGLEARRRRVAAGLPVWSLQPLAERSSEDRRLEAEVFAGIIDDGVMDPLVQAVKEGVEAFDMGDLTGLYVRGIRGSCEHLAEVSKTSEVLEAFDRMVTRLEIVVPKKDELFAFFKEEAKAAE